MGRNTIEVESDQENASTINATMAHNIIGHCILSGVSEFCICPGARNGALIDCLKEVKGLQTYFFFEERCAAFFALGRVKSTTKPVAVITTSGTAVGELLPAAMEGYYSGLPLLLISADRPRNYRGSGAPQSAEQVNIFGIYTPFSEDLQFGEDCNLQKWDQLTPAHLNISFEESYDHSFDHLPSLTFTEPYKKATTVKNYQYDELNLFLKESKNPIAIVSTLPEKDKSRTLEFLVKLGIPVYCEAVSGIRESVRLKHLRIKSIDKLWNSADSAGVSIDGVIRIGGVPTCRLWRDLEKNRIKVVSISSLPFPGLSWSDVIHVDLSEYLGRHNTVPHPCATHFRLMQTIDHAAYSKLSDSFIENPKAEKSLIHSISNQLPKDSIVYLGNSLPIREWDQCATYEDRGYRVFASRGMNGIDGQLSTFLGLCESTKSNWAIVGDLTAMYDLAAPWVIEQIKCKNINIIIINNSGGKIFSYLFKNEQLQNNHTKNFKYFAKQWGLDYSICSEFVITENRGPRIIEVIPA
ncbi:MAG: 2-succinyl-5-enolpyruvyl-6-hydroxy-3-cyclohexene-1-carboxylic-acid synthase [Chlamydiota bacterium]|nr:2-succinyl-5-enolpyruvyl-6-hydroxy-3-cyclohexene-1-carboxylic-acid synthase [Chlamydiota bacterium]